MKSFKAHSLLYQQVMLKKGLLWGPLFTWLFCLGFIYFEAPQDLGSLAFSLIAFYVVMAWISYRLVTQFNHNVGKVLILKLKHTNRYYEGMAVYLAAVGAFLALLGALAPIISGLISNSQFNFEWRYLSIMITTWFVLMSAIPLGISSGMFFQKQMWFNQNYGWLLLILFVVLGCLGETIISIVPEYIYLVGFLPPISIMAELLNTAQQLALLDITIIWLMSVGYSLVLWLVMLFALSKKQY